MATADFSAFLAQNKIKKENVKFVASQAFTEDGKPVKDGGKPLEWEIRALTSKEDDTLRKQSTKQVKVVGKSGVYRSEMDAATYIGKLAAACTVFPDLNNKELQDSYGVMGADELLKAMLSPGEYAEYCNKVSEVNDFDVDNAELVKEAKN